MRMIMPFEAENRVAKVKKCWLKSDILLNKQVYILFFKPMTYRHYKMTHDDYKFLFDIFPISILIK